MKYSRKYFQEPVKIFLNILFYDTTFAQHYINQRFVEGNNPIFEVNLSLCNNTLVPEKLFSQKIAAQSKKKNYKASSCLYLGTLDFTYSCIMTAFWNGGGIFKID